MEEVWRNLRGDKKDVMSLSDVLKLFGNDQAKIRTVVVEGIYKTKEDVLKKVFTNYIPKAQNVTEVMVSILEATNRLQRLELFKNDTIYYKAKVYEGPDAGPNEYILNVFATEKNYSGGTYAEIDKNNANLKTFGKITNVFGRGESLSAAFTINPKNGFNKDFVSKHLVFKKPIGANPDCMFNTDVFHSNQEYTWSGYKELAKGIVLGYSFPFMNGSHNIQWQGIWRELKASSPSTSFAVREESGHTLKSSVKYTYERDRRDHKLLPSKGTLFRIINEYAGLGGNVEFLKHEMEFQINQKFPLDTVLQLSLAGGIMRSLNTIKDIPISERFLLGGPTSLRGFSLQGVGPHMNGNALGADAYWLCGLHLYRPLPFNLRYTQIGRLFRTHLFVNAGNLVNIDISRTAKENCRTLSESFRASYGAGIVLSFGIAKLELNYVFPIRSMEGDRTCPGLQFGVGFEFS